MRNSFRRISGRKLNQILSRSLVIGAFSLVGLLSGLTPTFSNRSLAPVFSSSAYAQAISDEEVQNYARSVLLIEPLRQAAYNQIKQLLNTSTVPPIACHRPRSLNGLRRDVREIAVGYCNQSRQIAQANGLPPDRFNSITANQQTDSELQNRIQAELIRQQAAASQ